MVAVGCAEIGAEDGYEQVVVDYTDVGLDATDGFDVIDPGEVPADPCACGDDYQCLSDWAEEAFRCGICATITCPERNLDVCTDFCGIETESLVTSGETLDAER